MDDHTGDHDTGSTRPAADCRLCRSLPPMQPLHTHMLPRGTLICRLTYAKLHKFSVRSNAAVNTWL